MRQGARQIPKGRPLNRRQFKQVTKIVQSGQELKQAYTSLNIAFLSTGTLTEITALSKGSNYNQRDGEDIRYQSTKFEMAIAPTEAGNQNAVCRIMFVRSKKGPLVVADFPTTVDAEPNFDKMQVYKDQVYVTNDVTGEGSINNIRWFKSFKNRKTPHLNVGYVASVSATAGQNNPLYLYMVTSALVSTPTLQGYIRSKWFDKN